MTKLNNFFPDFQAIAFDLNGTSDNSVPDLIQALQLGLHELNLLSLTDVQMSHWIGNRVEKMIQRVLSYLKER